MNPLLATLSDPIWQTARCLADGCLDDTMSVVP
jgi:hypothetical protein